MPGSFVTATTLAALSKNRVYIHTFPDEDSEAGLQVAIDHIHLARSADLIPGGSCHGEYYRKIGPRNCRRSALNALSGGDLAGCSCPGDER